VWWQQQELQQRASPQQQRVLLVVQQRLWWHRLVLVYSALPAAACGVLHQQCVLPELQCSPGPTAILQD
jgi:hypothetical protein